MRGRERGVGVTPSSMTSVVPSNPALTAETPEGCVHRLRAPRGREGGEEAGDGVTQVRKEDLSCRLRASLDPQARPACPLPDHTGAVGQSFLNPSAHSRDTFAFGVQGLGREREFFIDNLLVRIYLIVKMTLVDRPCAMGV